MKKFWGFLVPVALAALVAVPVLARGPGGHRGPEGDGPGRGGHGPGAWLAGCLASPELGLTKDQQAKMDALRDAGREQMRVHRGDLRDLRKALHEAFLDPKATDADIRAKADALHGAMSKVRETMEGRLLEARKVLTADQLKRLKDLPACQPRGALGDRPRGPEGDGPDEE
jgi:Spy/CpxP family protein refolding chaperone